MSISEIHALLALMDDPDETVYTHVRERLLSKGKEVIPFVDSVASSEQNDALINGRLALLKEGLQQTDVKEALRAWMGLRRHGLVEGRRIGAFRHGFFVECGAIKWFVRGSEKGDLVGVE